MAHCLMPNAYCLLTTNHQTLNSKHQPPNTLTMPHQPSTEEITRCLHATMGKVSLAAEQLKCSPEAIYLAAQASPTLSEVLRLYRGKLLDAAETALWRAVIEGESWAVKWALENWGQSRGFSDGSEVWHAPHASGEKAPHELVRALAQEMLNDAAYTDYCRQCQLDSDSGDLRLENERRPLADDAAPGGDRPGDLRHDCRTDGADPGD